MDRAALYAAYAHRLTANLWGGSSRYRSFASANPGEAALVDAYVSAIVAGGTPTPPAVSTEFGKLIVGLVAAGLVPNPAPPIPSTNPMPPPATGVALCAYIECVQTYGHDRPDLGPWTENVPWSVKGWDLFEQDAGKPIWGLMTGGGNLWNGGFGDLQYILGANVTRGTRPIIDVDTSQMGTLAAIAAGQLDPQIDAAAATFKAFGKPVLLRIDAEMNGGWYRYGAEIRATPAGPANFVAAWRRIVTRFRAAGATNVAYHWCPNVDPDAVQFPLEQLYPGDPYVDWTGPTGYNHGNEGVAWTFGSTYDRIARLAPGKPMMIGETGSVDLAGVAVPLALRHSRAAAQAHVALAGWGHGQAARLAVAGTSNPTKAQWIADLGAWLPAHPLIRAVCWFNWRIFENGSTWDWEIESSPAALAAFKAFAASPTIVGR